jgi:repressor LexA
MKTTLTSKQQEVLDYIKEMTLKRGYPPSVRELCDAVNLKSTSSVHAHLESLEKKGFIRRDPTKPRAIEILDEEFNLSRREVVNVPIVGNVAAGQPLLAEQNIENYFPILPDFMKNNDVFMLKVRGDSMINCGIYDGDLLMVERTAEARDGEIVVAIIEDGATVKRFYRERNHIRLQPENDALEPIIVDHCEIAGRVFGLFRTGIEYDIKRITEFD